MGLCASQLQIEGLEAELVLVILDKVASWLKESSSSAEGVQRWFFATHCHAAVLRILRSYPLAVNLHSS
eukprot:4996345-Amphidinium_carterae.1